MPALPRDFKPSWVAFGWFIGAAGTALILLALVSIGIISDAPAEHGSWVAGAMAIGFAGGGFFAGARVGRSPVIYGVGIALFSLIVWFVANLALGEPTDQTAWTGIGTVTVIGLLALQAISAIVGFRLGARWAFR